jgi:prepilin-type N-terminal cleavage/methylation domain-containing protein
MRTKRTDGFTLIEVMVVIAIIATLIGTGSLMIRMAMKKKAITQTQGRLSTIGMGIEAMKNSDQLGRYPPTQLAKLSFSGFDGAKTAGGMNETNVGIETVYACARLKGINVPTSGLDEAVDNTDDDKAIAPIGTAAKPDLFEYVDFWGNPFVYINASDYKNMQKVEQYVLGNETHDQVKVEPHKVEKTGEFVRPDSFQLFSMGPDGKPNTEDDIMFGSM